MIVKLLSPQSPARPSAQDSAAMGRWRESVLMGLKSRVSPKGLALIAEKFLVPQQWKATAKTKAASSVSAEEEMMIEGIANGADPDRGREIIIQSAWKTESYAVNPIILFNHNHNWPIGTCVEYKLEDQGLYYRASIGNPKAYPSLTECQVMCRSLLAQGVLRASSVGFLPLNIEYDEENDILRYTEVELLEISLCSVPMQQGSILTDVGPAVKTVSPTTKVEGVKSMDKAQYDALMALCQKILEAATAPKDPPKDAAGEAAKEEAKALKLKVTELEATITTLKAEKESLEKDAGDLITALEKSGVVLEDAK